MSQLCIRWPKYWSSSFNISPSNELPGLISFRMDWLDLHALQGTLRSLLQHAKTHTNQTKTKHKERILKAAREKQQVRYKGNPIHLTADLSAETLQPEGNGSTEREKSTTKITVTSKDLIQNWWRNQSFSDKDKLREISTTKSALQQMLKGLI